MRLHFEFDFVLMGTLKMYPMNVEREEILVGLGQLCKQTETTVA